MAISPEGFDLRRAEPQDAQRLAAFERQVFDSDRISQRQFRYLLTRAHAETWLAEWVAPRADAVALNESPMLTGRDQGPVRDDGGVGHDVPRLAGYVTVLFSRGTAMARLYSIAVAPEARGSGLAQTLVAAAERSALAHESVVLRLEIRLDNVASQRLFKRLGYREFGRYIDFYEDHSDALRLEKRLVPAWQDGQPVAAVADEVAAVGAEAPRSAPLRREIPFYAQTLDFTCGPASLMMAMHALDPRVTYDRRLELRLWREATTIFMTSGLGGCGPYGLALAALRRGFDVRLRLRDDHIAFFDSVRSAEKKEVIRIVQDDMRAELEAAGVPIVFERLSAQELADEVLDGAVPVVLISSARIYGERFPHWVVVTGVDDHFVYVHDPFVDRDEGESEVDCIHLPIARREFDRMLRYGRAGLQAAVLLRSRGSRPGESSAATVTMDSTRDGTGRR